MIVAFDSYASLSVHPAKVLRFLDGKASHLESE
jgi:hypothetical protein